MVERSVRRAVMAAGLGQFGVVRRNPKTINFRLPDQLPIVALAETFPCPPAQ